MPLWCLFCYKWVAPVTCFHPYNWAKAIDITSVMMLHKIVMSVLQRDSFRYRLWASKWSCWEDPWGEGLRVVSGGLPQGSPIWIQKVLGKTVFFKSFLLLAQVSSHGLLCCHSCHNIVYILSIFSMGLIRQSCGPVSIGNMPRPNWEPQRDNLPNYLPW